MPLPAFNSSGDLPPGVHSATMEEVLKRFGTASLRRRMIAKRLERIYNIAESTGCLFRFVVFGSFVTNKPAPNDLDVFMLLENEFDLNLQTGESRLLFDHLAADTFFGASVFWLRRLAALDGEQAALEYWQTKREIGIAHV